MVWQPSAEGLVQLVGVLNNCRSQVNEVRRVAEEVKFLAKGGGIKEDGA
jgi:hypothetical protein